MGDASQIVAAGGVGALPSSDAGVGCLETPLCSFTPSEVACDVDFDCIVVAVGAVGGGVALVIGVNKSSAISCGSVVCYPQGPCMGYSLQTQDCRVEGPVSGDVGVRCVSGQCLSSWQCGECVK
jgi:hypothetical protein